MPPGTRPWATRRSTSSCIGLAIDLGRNQVEARDHGDQVGDHEVAAHLLDDAHGGERARADLAAVREGRAVAHHVPPHVAARALDAHVAVARRRLEVARDLCDHGARWITLVTLGQDFDDFLYLWPSDDGAV